MESLRADQVLTLASLLPRNVPYPKRIPLSLRLSKWVCRNEVSKQLGKLEKDLQEAVDQTDAASQWSAQFAADTENWIKDAKQDDVFIDPDGKRCAELEELEEDLKAGREQLQENRQQLLRIKLPTDTKSRLERLHVTWINHMTYWMQSLRSIRTNVVITDSLHESDSGVVFDDVDSFNASLK